MINTSHHHIPVGTIADHEGTPVTLFRDYACIEIGNVKIPLDQFPALRAILDDAEPDMIACEAEMAAEAEEREADFTVTSREGAVTAPCLQPAAHGYCGYTPPPVDCDVTEHHDQPEAVLTPTEMHDLALHGTEIITAAFQSDDPCECHGGEGDRSLSCPECREDAEQDTAARAARRGAGR